MTHQRESKSRQDARHARRVETTPSGLNSPKFGFLLRAFYLWLHRFREHKFLQSVDESSSYKMSTVQRSSFMGRRIVEQQASGDDVSMLDIVQRHRDVPFYSGGAVDDQNMLDVLDNSGATYTVHATLLRRGARDPSICAKANVEATRTIIDTAVAAGVRRLVYTSPAGVVFIGTDVVGIDEQVPHPKKLFDAYRDEYE
ncbi:hypothetical protein M404DRAFT_28454 [Pisolithus tinctorius Marx 270]|uniref:3-beta hydroxysteroid dehydrogenase/isomerase domain-containing protein n=1 Tax=Pisolithus tinctorius Marx 270 TaxID=870435 RepID=A0A0C3P341_PISTI|nr:hypothetical protein M404DRAFT_28454 [Pisolithus tinctorius Marx 270]